MGQRDVQPGFFLNNLLDLLHTDDCNVLGKQIRRSSFYGLLFLFILIDSRSNVLKFSRLI